MRKINSDTLEKALILEEVSTLADFYSITLPVEYGDGTLANEKFISLDELELILTSVLEEFD